VFFNFFSKDNTVSLYKEKKETTTYPSPKMYKNNEYMMRRAVLLRIEKIKSETGTQKE
jgi:ribosomal protein S26